MSPPELIPVLYKLQRRQPEFREAGIWEQLYYYPQFIAWPFILGSGETFETLPVVLQSLDS